MNRTVLVAFCAGILGAVVGAAFVVSFTTPAREMPSAPLSPGELEGAFRVALTPLRQSLERGFTNLEADLRAGFAMPVRVPVAEADPAAEGSPVADAQGTRAPVARRPGSGLPPPRPWTFEALKDWKDDPEVRRTWLFAPEADVLRNFGTPDHIGPAGLQETWIWYVHENGERVGKHVILLNKGRVVNYFD